MKNPEQNGQVKKRQHPSYVLSLKEIADLSDDALLRPDQAAAFLQLSTNALAARRSKGNGPRFLKHGQIIRYKKGELVAWLGSND